MVATARRMTADEFLALPPEPHTQLIDGKVVVTSPTFRHQRIVAQPAVFFDGAPDLVVEVRSPSTGQYDAGAKKAGYLDRGAEEVWLVDTEADQVAVCRRDGESVLGRGDTLTTPLLPGLAIDVGELFDR